MITEVPGGQEDRERGIRSVTDGPTHRHKRGVRHQIGGGQRQDPHALSSAKLTIILLWRLNQKVKQYYNTHCCKTV